MQSVVNATDDLAAQLRFESFRLGKPLPVAMSLKHQHRHSRSHSRNASISSAASLPVISSNEPSLPTTNSMPALSSKRNSHHRRRSSVSTRHESAEIMGVSLPDFSAPSVDESSNEKDFIRRRALWALEGKQDDASYSKVEIPELSSPDIEKKMFDFTSKSFSAPSSSSFGASPMANKRESFKPSSSKDHLHTLVEEEEEEEEWDAGKQSSSNDINLPMTPVTPDFISPMPVPARPRPATLTLRPFSLTPEVIANLGLPTPSSTPGARSGLKALSLVPSDENVKNRRHSLGFDDSSPSFPPRRPMLQISTERSASSEDESSRPTPSRRSSISYKTSSSTSAAAGLPTPEMTPTFTERRFSHNSNNTSASVISSTSDEDFFPPPPSSNPSYSRHRPLSISEQHFLFKSHNALLFRIQDLEKALSMRRSSMSSGTGSRPISSAFSSADSEDTSAFSEPSDEMLRLVSDLKAERDELKRDVDGWRTRVGDLEKQIVLLGKRIEGERREAWVARSRVGLLEAEKTALDKELEQTKRQMRAVEEEKDDEIARLKTMIRHLERDQQRQAQDNTNLLKECAKWKAEVDRLCSDSMATPTVDSFDTEQAHSAWRRGLHYSSIDSFESSTDVELDSDEFGFNLKAIEEESEEDLDVHGSQIPEEDIGEDYMSDENESGLAGYEDEEDGDLTFHSSTSSSSFGSVNEAFEPRSTGHLRVDLPLSETPSVSRPHSFASVSSESGTVTPTLTPGSRSTSSSPAPVASVAIDTFKLPRAQAPTAPTHRSIGSLSKTWTFPNTQSATLLAAQEEVDKFFSCLEDSETDSTGSRSPISPAYESNKGLFAKGLEAFDEDDAMFSLPANVVGIVVEDSPRSLPVVIEEEEGLEGLEDDDEQTRVDDDDDMFGDIAGIKITFTPAPDEDEDDDEYPSPQIEDSDDEDFDEAEQQQPLEETMEQGQPTVSIKATLPEEEEVVPQSRFSSARKPVPTFEEDFDDEIQNVSFNFGHPANSSTPPRVVASPSSIPRPRSSFNFSSSHATLVDTSPVPSSKLPVRSSPFVTPPPKRGIAFPSFIPQPVSSPSPIRKGPVLREKPPVASFIRQPARRPLMAANAIVSKPPLDDSNGSASPSNSVNFTLTNDASRFSFNRSAVDNNIADVHFFSQPDHQAGQSYTGSFFKAENGNALDATTTTSIGSASPSISTILSQSTNSNSIHANGSMLPSSLSSPSLSTMMTSPKMTLQTLAGFIPRPWSVRAESSVAYDRDLDDTAVSVAPPKPTLYVPKAKQLERLSKRLQHEGQLTRSFGDDVCQKCDGAVFNL
ncbi:hypothetical protein D9757_000382 [Collybiopsis confluens]|uniref:Uncharacterized protein n=1 Tax=Collybiopsis confluens TaxID=2823264 RepID=A0A8H5I2F0_9AGAR|nr:hypothetical protein D9757_000382 [Collybiopsis confluens]